MTGTVKHASEVVVGDVMIADSDYYAVTSVDRTADDRFIVIDLVNDAEDTMTLTPRTEGSSSSYLVVTR